MQQLHSSGPGCTADENISCILIWDLNNCRFASHTTWSFWENEKKILKEEQFLNCIFSKNLQIEIPAFKLLYVMYYKQFSRKKYLNGICHIKAQTYLFLMQRKITDFFYSNGLTLSTFTKYELSAVKFSHWSHSIVENISLQLLNYALLYI